jgi:hypothetical protein
MKSSEFWKFFDTQAAPRLALREKTFRKIFQYLDSLEGPVRIVETGCTRLKGNWAGDGQSTVIFDKYINLRDSESTCVTVDINEISVQACRELVSPRTKVFKEDSVKFLSNLVKEYVGKNHTISFLYLDSYDIDMNYWQPSAIHHLKELTIAIRVLNSKSLVVVDDCPATADFIPNKDNTLKFVTRPKVGGKGRLVAEFADAVGAKCLFSQYQAGWINIV